MFKAFLLNILYFSLALLLISSGIFLTLLKPYLSPIFWLVVPFISLETVLFHYAIVRSAKSRFAKFSQTYMLATMLKLFIYIVFLAVYIYVNREDRNHVLSFAATFLVTYISYMVFETIAIQRHFRNT